MMVEIHVHSKAINLQSGQSGPRPAGQRGVLVVALMRSPLLSELAGPTRSRTSG